MNDITISDGVITNTGTVHVIDTKQQSYYENLVICRKSGQISDQQWEEHLEDEVFRRYVEKLLGNRGEG